MTHGTRSTVPICGHGLEGARDLEIALQICALAMRFILKTIELELLRHFPFVEWNGRPTPHVDDSSQTTLGPVPVWADIALAFTLFLAH